MTDSVQISLSVKDPLLLKQIADLLIDSDINDNPCAPFTRSTDGPEPLNEVQRKHLDLHHKEFLKRVQEEKQEEKINEILPEEFIHVGPETVELEIEVDSKGTEYNPLIHSRGKSKLKDGTWKKRRKQGDNAAPPPPPVAQSLNSITYERFCDEIEKRGIDYITLNLKIEKLDFPPLPVLATRENDLYTLLKELTCPTQ